MVSHNYGSIWSGVYKRELITNNNIYFPEHLAYEDNYWVYAIQMLMNSVGILKSEYYYYRIHGESTVQKKNSLHHYDRLEISKKFLEYVNKNQLMDRYKTILEFLFIEVFTYNSFSIIINRFDHPNIDTLNEIKALLKENFPEWRKNCLYQRIFTIRKKVSMNMLMMFPTAMYIQIIKRLYSLFK